MTTFDTDFFCSRRYRLYRVAFVGVLAILILLALVANGFGQTRSQSSAEATAGSTNRATSPPAVKLRNSGPTLKTSPAVTSEEKPSFRDANGSTLKNDSHSSPFAASNRSSSDPNTMEGLNDKRPLMIGDKISLSILEDESPRHSLAITDSGEIDAPYIGRVSASSMTCKQLAYHLKRLLEREYYHQATVIVALDAGGRGVSSRGRIYVSGQVRSPGPQEIPADEVYTVGTAILRAGGFSQYAQKRKVKLIRASSEKAEAVMILDLVEILDKGDRQRDIEVGPGDQINVPEKMWNFFN